MRFLYVDRSGRKVEVQTLEGLAARLELGAITPETMLYDAVSDRWAPAGEHEFYRSLVRTPGRDAALPVTPPGLVPSTEEVEPVVGTEKVEGGDEEWSRSPEPRVRGSFAGEDAPGSSAAHNALFDLVELEGTETSDPLDAGSDLSVLPEEVVAPREIASPPLPPFRKGSPEVERPPPGSAGSPEGPRELTLEELDFGEPPAAAEGLESDLRPELAPRAEGLELAAQASPGSTPEGVAGAREAEPAPEEDWRYVPGAPPPGPLRGLEPGTGEEEGYWRATRSTPASGAAPGAARRRGPARRPPDAPVVRSVVLLGLVLVAGWYALDRWGPLGDTRAQQVPPALRATLEGVSAAAFEDMLMAMDSIAMARGLPDRPGRDWLEGVYLAFASRFEAEGAYWVEVRDLVRDLRLSEDSLFENRLRARVGSLGLSSSQEGTLVEEAVRRFDAARGRRLRVYAQAEGIAAAAAELHTLLVEHEEEILYEPFTVSGVSRDPVIEAVPTNRPLAERMWSLIDRVTRGLQDMDAIMGVSTRSFVQGVIRGLRVAGWA